MRSATALTLALAALAGTGLVLLFGWQASQAPPTVLVVTPRPLTSPTPAPTPAQAPPPPTRPVAPTPEPTAAEVPGPPQQPIPPGCGFVGGFEVLARFLGRETVGDCLENEHTNPVVGNVEQRTSGGLLVWLKDQNLSAFTDGTTTWYVCPGGIEQHPSDEPFACMSVPANAEES